MDRLSREFAAALDRADPLAPFRSRFYLPDGKVYLDGNSLGLASKDAEAAVVRALEGWKKLGVEAWTEEGTAWFDLCERIGRQQAPLVGALPHEVVVTGGTTVNLHALVATFYDGGRIVTDDGNFPSDVYALRSQATLCGGELTVVRAGDEPEAAVEANVGKGATLVLVSAVDYRTGRLYDIERLARAAHDAGALLGIDASHSAGCVPHRLHDWEVDFAFWCNYKYLNGGPGAVASLFVHERHHGRRPALAGWWGSDKQRQFRMGLEFLPANGAGAWQIGTPPILSAAAVEGALQITVEAGIEHIRRKSLAQTRYLMELVDARLAGRRFSIVTPPEDPRRGGHVALSHAEAGGMARALRRRGVVPDFRPPDILRLAPAALYTTFVELWACVEALKAVTDGREYEVVGAGELVT